MIGMDMITHAADHSQTLTALIAELDSWGFTIANTRISVWTVSVVSVAIVAGLMLARVLIKWFRWLIGNISGIDSTQKVLADKLVAIAVWTVTFLLTIDLIGIDLTTLAVFSGAFGLALGFGLQKTFGNLLAGIILLMDRSIKPGDVIGVNDGVTQTMGQVKKIGIRAVSVTTRDKKEYLIPNENLMINQVENWSHTSRDVRLNTKIAIAHSADTDLAEQLMLRAASETHRVLKDPAPTVWLEQIARDALHYDVFFWISDPEEGIGNVRSELLKKIWRSFGENGIQVPYPQQDVNLRDTAALRHLIQGASQAKGDGKDTSEGASSSSLA